MWHERSHFALYEALLPYYRSKPGDYLLLAPADGHGTPDSAKELGVKWLVQRLKK